MMRYHHWCDREEKVPLARKLVREGKTLKEIAKAIGFKSDSAVRSWLRRYEIPTSSRRKA